MKKRTTALSVRTHRRRKRLNYRALEAKQLLAADVFSTVSPQVCDHPDRVVQAVAPIDLPTAEIDNAFTDFKSADATGEESERQLPVGVSEVVIDGGTESRSMVQSITLIFDGIVDPQSDAFELIQRETGDAVDLMLTIDNTSGVSHVTLTFSGALATKVGSLVDGYYQLNVAGDLLGSSSGGTDFVFGDQEEHNMHRFFGDSNGDRNINVVDLLGFRKTFRLSQGDKGFDPQFDINGDETINVFDLLGFRSNYRETLAFA